MNIASFKDDVNRNEFFKISPTLQLILCDSDILMKQQFKKDLIITSLLRMENMKSPHYYGRAADLRISHLEEDEIKYLINYLNSKYIYNYKHYQTAEIHENRGSTGKHLHIQINHRIYL